FFLTGGGPISGLPYEFGNFLGFGRVFGVPVPVLVAVIATVALWLLMNRTRLGAHIYAVWKCKGGQSIWGEYQEGTFPCLRSMRSSGLARRSSADGKG